jgi:hypothetical protein
LRTRQENEIVSDLNGTKRGRKPVPKEEKKESQPLLLQTWRQDVQYSLSLNQITVPILQARPLHATNTAHPLFVQVLGRNGARASWTT